MLNIWNWRSALLTSSITSVNQDTITVDNGLVFDEAPCILTITTGLDWNALVMSERVLMTERNGNTLTITRGYDGSTAKVWTRSLSSPVYVYNIATAGYFDDLSNRLTALENAEVTFDPTGLDLDLGVTAVRSLTVGDGLSNLQLFETALIAPGALNVQGTSLTLTGATIQLDGVVSINGLTLSETLVELPGLSTSDSVVTISAPVTMQNTARFNEGVIFAGYEMTEVEGAVKFITTGDKGFYGYYDNKWNKLGFTAQLIVGQNSLMYCYLDGEHSEGLTAITVKEVSGTVQANDTLFIGGNPYIVTHVDGLDITITPGLATTFANNTPIMVTRAISDAAEGMTMRFNSVINNWAATNILTLPSDPSDPTVLLSSLVVDRDVRVTGGLVLGEHVDIESQVPGAIEYKNNNFYATVLVESETGLRSVQYSLIPDQAFEFLAAVNIPHTEQYRGATLFYDLDALKWLPTAKLRILEDKIAISSKTVFSDAVTFEGMVNLEGGSQYTSMVYFTEGLSLNGVTDETGKITWNTDQPYWTGRNLVGDVVSRPFAQIPWLSDVNTVNGNRKGFILYSDSDSDGSNSKWTIKPSNAKLIGGSLRYPALMGDDDPTHRHPWSEIYDVSNLPNDFESIQIGSNSDTNLPKGKYTIKQDFGMKSLSIQFDRTDPTTVSLVPLRINTSDEYILPDIHIPIVNTMLRGNLYVKALPTITADNVDYVRGGQLFLDGALTVGSNLSAPQKGMIRYANGDLQGYCFLGLDESGNSRYGWQSLTNGLPRPDDQLAYGMLTFDGSEWIYTDKVQVKEEGLVVSSDVIIQSDLQARQAAFADVTADSLSIGTNDPAFLKEGAVKIANHSILVYLDGTWKDLLALNAVSLDSIGITPVTDGATLRFDLGTGLWQQTTNLTVTDTGVTVALDVTLEQSLTVTGNATIGGNSQINGDAWIQGELTLNTPRVDPFEGRIRYNGDFQGYIPHIGWTSFTRRFGASVVAPATASGQILTSFETSAGSGKFNWGVASDLTVTNDSITTGRDVAVGSLTATRGVFTTETILDQNTCYNGLDLNVGLSYAAFKQTSGREPMAGDLIIIENATYTILDWHYNDSWMIVHFTPVLSAPVAANTVCTYGKSAFTTSGQVSVDLIKASSGWLDQLTIQNSCTVRALTVGDGGQVVTPGSIKYENNHFYGMLEGGWQEFGPIDIREYFNLPSTNLGRSYGDILIYDGDGRWQETNALNVRPFAVAINTPTFILNEVWNIASTYTTLGLRLQNGKGLVIEPDGMNTLDGSLCLTGSFTAPDQINTALLICADIEAQTLLTNSLKVVQNVEVGSLTTTDSVIIGSNLSVSGQVSINGNAQLDGGLSVLGSFRSGVLAWSKQTWPDQEYALSLDTDYNLSVKGMVVAGSAIVPGMTTDNVKGAIRYTSEGQNDRGDWEGWNGEYWVSFTDNPLQSIAGIPYGTLYYNPQTERWESSIALEMDDKDVRISGTLTIDGILNIPNDLQVGSLTANDQIAMLGLDGVGIIIAYETIDGTKTPCGPMLVAGSDMSIIAVNTTFVGQSIIANVSSGIDLATSVSKYTRSIKKYLPVVLSDAVLGDGTLQVFDNDQEFDTSVGLLYDGSRYSITNVDRNTEKPQFVTFTISPALQTNIYQMSTPSFIVERTVESAVAPGSSTVKVYKTSQYGTVDNTLFLVINDQTAYKVESYTQGSTYDTVTLETPLVDGISKDAVISFGVLSTSEINLRSATINMYANTTNIENPVLNNVLKVEVDGSITNVNTGKSLTLDSILQVNTDIATSGKVSASLMSITPGNTPSVLSDGMLWGTINGLFYRANGTTYQLGVGALTGDTLWQSSNGTVSLTDTNDSLHLYNGAYVEGALNVIGNADISANATIHGTLTVQGDLDISSDFVVQKQSSLTDTVTTNRILLTGREIQSVDTDLLLIGKSKIQLVGSSAASSQKVPNPLFTGTYSPEGTAPSWVKIGTCTTAKDSTWQKITWDTHQSAVQGIITSPLMRVVAGKWYKVSYTAKQYLDNFGGIFETRMIAGWSESDTSILLSPNTGKVTEYGSLTNSDFKTITYVFRAPKTESLGLAFTRKMASSWFATSWFSMASMVEIEDGLVEIPGGIVLPTINADGTDLYVGGVIRLDNPISFETSGFTLEPQTASLDIRQNGEYISTLSDEGLLMYKPIRNIILPVDQLTGGGTISVSRKNMVLMPGTLPSNITSFSDGVAGQRITVVGQGVTGRTQYRSTVSLTSGTVSFTYVDPFTNVQQSTLTVPFNTTGSALQTLINNTPDWAGRFYTTGGGLHTGSGIIFEAVGPYAGYNMLVLKGIQVDISKASPMTNMVYATTLSSGMSAPIYSDSGTLYYRGISGRSTVATSNINMVRPTGRATMYADWISYKNAVIEFVYDGFYWNEICRNEDNYRTA